MLFNFGSKMVGEEEKKTLVSNVFASVSRKYSFMNNLMSFGLQNFWKSDFVDLITLKDGGEYLDLASGNGDIALLILEKARREGKSISITMCDASDEMLEIAKQRVANSVIESGNSVKFVSAFAEEMPFQKSEFDGVFISFGIRNFTNLQSSLQNIYNSLKDSSDLYILEFFSDVSSIFAFNKLYKFYLLKIIPKIGKIITKSEGSYQYFGESILNFFSKKEFQDILERAKFRLFSATNSKLEIATFFHFKKYE